MLRRSLSICAVMAALVHAGWSATADAEQGRGASSRIGRPLSDPATVAVPEAVPDEATINTDAQTPPDLPGTTAPGTQPASPDSGTTASPPTSSSAEEQFSPSMLALRSKVRKCLSTYYHEPIQVADHSPWGIMHALIAYGVDTEILSNGRNVNAVGHLCFNQPGRGMQLMTLNKQRIEVRIGPGYQGHSGQFLAMLAQSKVRTDYPIRIEGHEFTVADLIESEKLGCRTRTELTFKLIGLSHYLPLDAQWKNDLGEPWSISRLIKEELAQNVVGSACGGTHRMTGFSYAVNKTIKLGGEFEGQFLRAKKFVDSYHEYIFKLQNADGSFSTNWFEGRGEAPEAKRRVETTGHMLEWLVCSLAADELQDPRVVKSVDYLSGLLLELAKQKQTVEIGPRGHAIHGLAIYADRVFGDRPGERDTVLARKAATKSDSPPAKR